MTDDERAEYELLKLASDDTNKFAIEMGRIGSEAEQYAMERLQLRDWVRLIDVTPIAASGQIAAVFRVFRVMPDALTWFRAQG